MFQVEQAPPKSEGGADSRLAGSGKRCSLRYGLFSVAERSVFLGLVILSLFTPNAVVAVTGKVVGVHDGDSLTLLTSENVQIKVRLECIDAPELQQPFGVASKKALSDLVFDKTVRLEETGKDRYKRTLGNIYIGETSVNPSMVEKGMAWFLPSIQLRQVAGGSGNNGSKG